MTSEDLAYWLQGAFEIVGITEITDVQVDCIRRHIALVRVTDAQSVFAGQVDALLGVASAKERCDLIRAVTANLFEHVIDPQHPKPAAANAAHHGGGGAHVLMRC